ncbi:MAG: hypothetical protein CMP67_05245 [Flavobacteriales bacterium]|nr:hypothetical protein [Flavobacteriales bacterium]MBO72963.1 hypothetical protein [Flavobacteriales bacterium]|tara:strand:- start:635 stop:1258 length:624 start_codon:yes stop_codon:yes gene_type:complete
MKNLFFLLILLPLVSLSQNDSVKTVVKIAGVTVTSDSLKPVPFVNVLIKGNYSGTMADYTGFYSIIAKAGDTLIFSSMGYRNEEYVIPDTLKNEQYSLIQILNKDTVELPVTTIKVWPSYEQFKQAFLNVEIKDGDLARAKKNLDHDILREQALNLHLGELGNQKYMLDQQKSRLYSIGQLPANNYLNPAAWKRFIKAWKDGEFKKD